MDLIATLNITDTQHIHIQHKQHSDSSAIMLSLVVLKMVMLRVVMLEVVYARDSYAEFMLKVVYAEGSLC